MGEELKEKMKPNNQMKAIRDIDKYSSDEEWLQALREENYQERRKRAKARAKKRSEWKKSLGYKVNKFYEAWGDILTWGLSPKPEAWISREKEK